MRPIIFLGLCVFDSWIHLAKIFGVLGVLAVPGFFLQQIAMPDWLLLFSTILTLGVVTIYYYRINLLVTLQDFERYYPNSLPFRDRVRSLLVKQ